MLEKNEISNQNHTHTHTVFPTKASVKAMDADLLHAGLTGAVEESLLHLGVSSILQHASFLQLVLVVQERVL